MRMQQTLACLTAATAVLAAIPAQAALTPSASLGPGSSSLLAGSSFTPTFSLGVDASFPVLSMSLVFEYDPGLLSLMGMSVAVDGTTSYASFADFVTALDAPNVAPPWNMSPSFLTEDGTLGVLSVVFLGVPQTFTFTSSLTFTPTFEVVSGSVAGTPAKVRFSGSVVNDDTGEDTRFDTDVTVTALVPPPPPDPNAVPEPSQAALVLTGLAALALATRARRRH